MSAARGLVGRSEARRRGQLWGVLTAEHEWVQMRGFADLKGEGRSPSPRATAPPASPPTPTAKRTIPVFPPHENIYTFPNLLTLSRLLSAPALPYLILTSQAFPATLLFLYAALTDLADGYLARRWKLQTVVGSILDPMADKVFVLCVTGGLVASGSLPIWLAALILSRDALLALSAIWYRYISLPPPKTLARFWDFSLPSAEVRPTTISKYNTALQLALLGLAVARPLLEPLVGGAAPLLDLRVLQDGLQYLVAATTVGSGVSYLVAKDAVRFVRRGEAEGEAEGKKVDGPTELTKSSIKHDEGKDHPLR
ncbi:MAG: hypothetical protein M1824_006446 [Vezdaea acicularis]|nr:MAG: hypothetical protein M1824_006446 [Vezdaea acicularis]